MLYPTVNDDDDEVDQLDGDDAVSSQSESDDDNDLEEGELQTPVNPIYPVNHAISVVRKWSISVGREYRVVKVKMTHGPARSYHHSDANYCSWYIHIKKKATHGRWKITRFVKEHTCLIQIEQNKHINLSSKFISMSISHLVATDPEIPMSNIIQEVQCVEKIGQEQILMCWRYIRDKCTEELTKRIFIRVLSENFWRDVPFNLTSYPPNMKKERGRKKGK
ncbi:hypothetical protein M9H77_11893 [Catharanthus roseus]|uniref:Uncharacterized protein n=1 Tax=Catharanthus roseus TaxID=4058 RepID=A0ACC0BFZ0_CATRO|nr:hypothetical protein M9H77_11893 [Catharanthus roseus]